MGIVVHNLPICKQVNKSTVIMKFLPLLLFVAIAMPALTHGQFLEAVTLVGLGAVGAGLAVAGAAAIATAFRPRRVRYHHKPRYYHRHHYGKREANEEEEEGTVDELMNTILEDINDKHIEGCFQRLLCDITANPEGFKGNTAIKDAVTMSEKLLEAVKVGQKLSKAGFGVKNCEAVFNQCPFSGEVMDQIITQYRSFSEKY